MTTFVSPKVILWLFLVVFTFWVYIYFLNTAPQSLEDLCKNSQDFETKVKACGDILRKSDGKYLMLVKAIEHNSRLASGAREEIKKARDEFYKTTLSGLNVDF